MSAATRIRPIFLSVMAAALGVRVAAAQAEPVTIVVLPFDDRGSYGQDNEVFRALELGIPAVLASELGSHPRVRLVDHTRVEKALKTENLGEDARLDAATAGRIGSQAGARFAVTGNFADFYGKFRIDARLVDVSSGQIVKVVSNSDPKLQDRADLHRIIQDLAGRILTATSLSAPSGAAAQRRLIPTEALTQYSLGLLYEHQGDRAKAREHYQRALTASPDFAEAQQGIQRVR